MRTLLWCLIAAATLCWGCTGVVSNTGESSEVSITFTTSDPTSRAILFSSSTPTVVRGTTLNLTTSNSLLLGLTGWEWYVDNVLDGAQTTASFSWDTTGKQPGQYLINVGVVYGGVKYTGSLRVTVTY